MTPIERFLYEALIRSPGFNRFVQSVYNRVNKITIHRTVTDYRPTMGHKINAFRIIWINEVKDLFRFRH
ncbi:hypothetical protein CANTEDRAFT_116290 [Yamadazyma tenuis ATCC 10573]|uniref:Uncharacterized protein n=1 Tax=Candida tenuis (strain ATCC 10573 / BCRC 21748 / CBS 615 / JCM 9827 / NBRC 10315 / NRRL Y-1498 / VKM Y-70) TaxID=590646 RepID=G3BCY6_CANTC|nr:uncharacterized protein CANTEDRAFT_116290 [Yamadazyma tenuis ATCC 10573]XP_006690277.1 uncharacterized protein CANTEDRAFT_116290 [Yamadazyma tenuis ATCC 10573]EGV61062.1 hypothetical protein CANTEDRAFT_116290 [Yamadazyma tenuis ATCC 10573]EGV61063.1 hypothetical protein CANTEDRAFT_116290 [Yamadazyma tenuis ATCC 10573]